MNRYAENRCARGAAGVPVAVVTCLAAAVTGAAPAVATTRDQVLRSALGGRTAPQIIAAAAPGVRLRQLPPRGVRVLVGQGMGEVVLSGQTRLTLTAGRGAARALPAGHRHLIRRAGAGFAVRDIDLPGSPEATVTGPLLVNAGAAATGIRIAEPVALRYRGAIRILAADGGTMSLVNVVPVEGYVKGVLPGSMPPAWGARAPEALRAGAVAVRSTALAGLRSARTATWDVTVDDPLYLGVDGERPATDTAVDGSRGWVLQRGGVTTALDFPGIAPLVFVADPGRPEPIAAVPAHPIAGAPDGVAAAALKHALDAIGTPYSWGGESPGGFDCSGLVFWAYGLEGVTLPRVADDQARVGYPVSRAELRPGDAVFFADSSGYVHHMGLYVGGNRFVHAPQSGETVRLETITGHYARQYAGARRFSR